MPLNHFSMNFAKLFVVPIRRQLVGGWRCDRHAPAKVKTAVLAQTLIILGTAFFRKKINDDVFGSTTEALDGRVIESLCGNCMSVHGRHILLQKRKLT